MLIFVNACYQLMTSASRPSTKTGPIIGGVVAALAILVLGAVIIWFFLKRRRRRQASQRRALPILESEDIKAIPPSRFLSPGAQSTSIAGTTQVPISSHFYAWRDKSLIDLYRLVRLSTHHSRPPVIRLRTLRLPRGQMYPGHLCERQT